MGGRWSGRSASSASGEAPGVLEEINHDVALGRGGEELWRPKAEEVGGRTALGKAAGITKNRGKFRECKTRFD